MVKIVIVTEIKRKIELREVLTDNSERYIISLDSIVQYNIRPDSSYSDKEWDEILIQSETRIGMNYAIDYLSYGMKSEREIIDKLKDKKINHSAIANIINRLKELQYLDDNKYAAEYINIYSNNRGKLRLRNELYHKGIDKKIIDNALDSIIDEKANCIAAANKIAKGVALEGKDRERLIRQLLSRGYTYDIIKAAIDSLGGNIDDLSDI